MNFDFTEEQNMLRDSVERFVQDNYSLEARVEFVKTKQGFESDNWKSFAELGWLAMTFDEAHGGFGGNQLDTMLMMEVFGKGLVVEPYLACITLGANALVRGDNESLQKNLLPQIIDGSAQLCFAYSEEQSRYDLHDVITTAQPSGDGFVLNGHKSMVLNAASASHIVVAARTSGGQMDENGISLFLIESAAVGVTLENFPTVDGLRASEIDFDKVKVGAEQLISPLDKGFDILQSVINDATLAVSAEAVGAMEILYKDTVEYTQQREQFDHPLAEFQALQHRMVEMFMEYEQCKSLLYRATMETVQVGPVAASRTIHALKHLVGKVASFIGESAVQLHGGMGMTEELRVGHYFKRLLVIESQFGNTDHHLNKFAA